MRLALVVIAIAAFLLVGVRCVASLQRKFLYFPSHHVATNGLTEWRHDGRVVGYARRVAAPRNIWLLCHGNAGQAADRAYALASFSPHDAVFILEYPGYGAREGTPSMKAFNAAATEAYELLRVEFPCQPVCVAGESIGTGPASALAANKRPPEKIVLVVPFDVLSSVASDHLPFLPTKLLLLDNWNNLQSLAPYAGRVEIFAARDDTVIPIAHARALAASKPGAVFHEITGGHNDWSLDARVTIGNP